MTVLFALLFAVLKNSTFDLFYQHFVYNFDVMAGFLVCCLERQIFN
jgi:hypothetical protein